METAYDKEIDAVTAQLHNLAEQISNDAAARGKLCAAVRKEVTRLESPLELCWQMLMSPFAPAAITTLLEMGAIEKLAQTPGPISAQRLCAECNADDALIVRLLRPLVALGFVREIKEQVYESTSATHVLTDPSIAGGFKFIFTTLTHVLSQMPASLRSNGYRNIEAAPGPFQFAQNNSEGFFEWLAKTPEQQTNFDAFMKAHRVARGDWFDRLPVDAIFLDGAGNDPERVLLVDIGGGQGQDIQAFHRAFPNTIGKLILQDQPQVIESIQTLDSAITRQAHDFFAPQPIKGARAYYMRSILHDWPVASCVEILKQIAKSMERGYSKLLLNEWVLPQHDAPLYPSLLDISMLSLLNGNERTAKQWEEIISAAGLKAIRFYTEPTSKHESIIEVELE